MRFFLFRSLFILPKFNFPNPQTHDIGNAINRKNHGEYGCLLAYHILEKEGMALEDRI
jgi:hypothetical protein